MQIVFIVYGENVPVECAQWMSLGTARSWALEDSRNTGRPEEDWDLRDANGTYLDPSRKIADYRFPDGVRIFASIRVGAGGSMRAIGIAA